jgi:hypothetical protein
MPMPREAALPRRSLPPVFGILCVLSLVGPPISAQKSPPAAGKQDPSKGEAIRLYVRGRPGDLYTYKRDTHLTVEFNLSVSPEQQLIDTTSQENWTFRVRNSTPRGALLMEVRASGGTETTTEHKKTATKRIPPSAALFAVAPSGAVLAADPLPSSATAAPTKPGKKSGAGKKKSAFPEDKKDEASSDKEGKPTLNAEVRRAAEAFSPFKFPEKNLKIGTTWTGALPIGRVDREDSRESSHLDYTARLVTLETYRGRPCAKVEYTFEGDLEGDLPSVRRRLPPRSKMTGKAEATGTMTAWYTRDRGALLDSDLTLKIHLNFHIVAEADTDDEARADLDGYIDVTEKETAVTFPETDPTLLLPAAPPAENARLPQSEPMRLVHR